MADSANGNGRMWKAATALISVLLTVTLGMGSYIHIQAINRIERLEVARDLATVTAADTEYLKENFAKFLDAQMKNNREFQQAITEFKVAIAELRAKNP